MQVYVLSILCNVLSGFVLFSSGPEAGDTSKDLFKKSSFRLILGVVTAVVGFLKILSVAPLQGNYPVIGDIVPAIGGLAAGWALIYEFYRMRATISSPSMEKMSAFITTHQKIIAGVAVATAILHLLIPEALFL
jgi:uncharacterized YccA/Bax inhibitor family protein